jgi:magnesium chelatase subunit D
MSTVTSVEFPFTAVVGMDDLGLALCLSAVSPGIGGVLVRGEKGTAKSTMVRALAAVLPPVSVVEGCRFACDPQAPDPGCPDGPHTGAAQIERPVRLVELPVGASEDRVVGSLHLDRLLSSGEVAFEPGLLAQAHRGVIYVDEVNLLPDHLVDTLLDSAAMGRARVEREGVSVTHAARFVLVGTMNPEEGELRPQLLDRFGLTVDVAASRDPGTRVEVVRRRLAYEADPAGFAADRWDDERLLAQRILSAEKHLAQVVLTDEAVLQIAEVCAAFDVDGMRGDLVTARTAIAHAAWSGRDVVSDEDVRVAARLALPHRRRRSPFDSPGAAEEELEDILDRTMRPDGPDDEPDPDGPEGDGPDSGGGVDGTGDRPHTGAGGDESRGGSGGGNGAAEMAGRPYAARVLTVDRAGRGVAGRRANAQTLVGRHLRGVPAADDRGHGLSLTATIQAALSQQTARGRVTGEPVLLAPQDIRRSLRHGREGNLVVFVCDASGSMGAARRMREVKTAVVSLLLDAYQRRDRVAVVTFARHRADVILPPTGSVELAQRRLTDIATGGRTPLAEGLVAAADLVLRERTRHPQRRALVVVLTDGRATAGAGAVPRALAAGAHVARRGIASVVVDCESGRGIRLGLARDVARALGAEYLHLGDIAADALTGVVRDRGVA